MKLTKLSIDGYGRFSDKELELYPALQVLAGPNEQGKSTLRSFITDMLYGQKRSTVQRLYEDSNALLEPWAKGNGYGGRLVYTLDSGRVIEVQRSFDRNDEQVHVFDKTNAREITGEFPVLRNRESTFAEQHLGLTKEVFLSIATITHMTLDALGDKRALVKIREKLLSLTDSGTGQSSAEGALKWLNERVATIGQPGARTKPLPSTRARLMDLQKEYELALEVRGEVAGLEQERLAVIDEIDELLGRRASLERELDMHEKIERAERLRKAEKLSARIDEITKICFELGAVRDFPSEQTHEVNKTATLVATAELQVERTRKERDSLQEQLDAELERLGPDSALAMGEIDQKYEDQLAEFESKIHRLNDRLEETENLRAAAEQRHSEAQKDVAELPDFSRVASDPVEWLTQLANSFGVARRTRDDEVMQLQQLQEAVETKRKQLEAPEAVFSQCEDFPDQAQEYERRTRQNEGVLARLQREADKLRGQLDEQKSKVPAYMISSLLSLAGVFVSLIAALLTGNPGIYLVVLCAALLLAFLVVNMTVTRRAANRTTKRLEQIDRESAGTREADANARQLIEKLMGESGCQTVRELEALFDRHRENTDELARLDEQREEQQKRTDEALERVRQLFERLRETFTRVGEEVDTEEDIQGAAVRAVSRYQEYRDAKRRSGENRETLERRQREIESITEELNRVKKEERDLSLELRQLLRDNGYREEHQFDSALKAMRGYKIRSAQLRHKRGQVEVAQGKLAMTSQRLEAEQAELDAHSKKLQRHFKKAGVTSIEEHRDKAARAQEYNERRKDRKALEEQLNVLLRSETLAAVREAVKAAGPVAELTARSVEELKRDVEEVNESIDAKRKQEHALHITITERAAGTRSINEIDEERAATELQVRELEMELQAASYAVSIIEEVTREQHTRVAPQLASQASAYLDQITGGAYDELLIDRDMQISVRIPERKTLNQDPERFLSKGTVDQIYLALRLAMIQTMSQKEERIPMLLDDPFANYDDARLGRAMKLLVRVAETNQILLFTCRDDVVRAAKATKTPIVRL